MWRYGSGWADKASGIKPISTSGRTCAAIEGVEDTVRNSEIVDGGAVRLFRIDVGRAPLQRAFSIAGGEEIMGAEVDRNGAEAREFSQELLAVGGIKVVGFVRSEVIPQWNVRPNGLVRVYVDGDGRLLRRNSDRNRNQQRQEGEFLMRSR